MIMKMENGQTIRRPGTGDILPVLDELKRIAYLTKEDEAQRMAHLLWREGFVILEHE